jgi:Cu/Ag efflux pump CusA
MFWEKRAGPVTDNSPISMIETIILLKPQNEWREGTTKSDIITEIKQAANSGDKWVYATY